MKRKANNKNNKRQNGALSVAWEEDLEALSSLAYSMSWRCSSRRKEIKRIRKKERMVRSFQGELEKKKWIAIHTLVFLLECDHFGMLVNIWHLGSRFLPW